MTHNDLTSDDLLVALVAARDIVAAALPDAAPRDLAPLVNRFSELSREIAALREERADEERAQRAASGQVDEDDIIGIVSQLRGI